MTYYYITQFRVIMSYMCSRSMKNRYSHNTTPRFDIPVIQYAKCVYIQFQS